MMTNCACGTSNVCRFLDSDSVAHRSVARVGKMDAKKHLDTQLNQLMSANILQCMYALALIIFKTPSGLSASSECSEALCALER